MMRARKMYAAIEMIITIIKLIEKLKAVGGTSNAESGLKAGSMTAAATAAADNSDLRDINLASTPNSPFAKTLLTSTNNAAAGLLSPPKES